MKKKTLHRIIIAIPGVVMAIILRATGLVSTGITGLLILFDVIGAIAGSYWLIWSARIADRLHDWLGKR